MRAHSETSCREQILLRAHGRCKGAMIFSVFAGMWMLLSLWYFGRLRPAAAIGVCGVAVVGILAARRIRHGQPDAQPSPELAAQKQRDDRRYVWINAVTYTLVFLLFAIFPRLGWANYVFPAFVAMVGLHFLPMPPLYRYRSNTITGLVMVFWAGWCAFIFRENGYRIAAWVTLGAGTALWAGTAAALWTAHLLFRIVDSRKV